VALVLLLGVPLVVGAPWLVALCFGPAFHDAALPARLLAPGAGAWSVGRVLGAVLRAVGAPGAAARCDLVAALAVVGGLLVLTPRWGLSGAAAAVSLGSLGGTAVAVSATARALRGNDRRGAVPACVPLTARSAALTPSPAGGGPLGCPGGHGEPRG
jgi:O-antigen/teichoic acid export membrane protein